MYGDNTTRHIVIAALHEACVCHHSHQRVLIGVFTEAIETIPEGSVLVFSAHGVSPEVRQKAKARKLRAVDATCPLVTKVHGEAIRYAKAGLDILLIIRRRSLTARARQQSAVLGQSTRPLRSLPAWWREAP